MSGVRTSRNINMDIRTRRPNSVDLEIGRTLLAVVWTGDGDGWWGATHIVDHNNDVGDEDEDETNKRQCSDNVKADKSPGFPRQHIGAKIR